MSGSDQSVNLGGMLSQTGAALGSMGRSYSGKLGRNIENMSRPDADPTDIASQQSLMQWQNQMGRTDAARTTQAGINNMQAQRAKQQKAAAEGKVANLTASMQQIETNPNMTREHKNQTQAMLQEELTALSAQVGRNLGNTLTQIQGAASQEQRAVDAAQRAKEAADHEKKNREAAEIDKAATAEFYTLPVEERETYIAEAREKGQVAVADKLETRMRQDVRWAEEREEQAKKNVVADMVAVTEGERAVIETDIAALKLMNEAAGVRFEANLKSIEEDTQSTVGMKRQKVDALYQGLSRLVTNQTSSAITSARTAAKEVKKGSDLKNPALGLYVSDSPARPAPAMQAVREARDAGSTTIANAWRFMSGGEKDAELTSADELVDWIDTVGDESAARLAAAIVTTYPETTMQQALIIAAKAKLGTGEAAGLSAATTTTNNTTDQDQNKSGLQVGFVMNGMRYIGGDRTNPSSWEKVE